MSDLADRHIDTTMVGQLATKLRADAIRCSTAAGSGHPTSSMSAADLTAVLLARHLRYDWDHPDHPDNDHFILSKGHASPLLYAAFKAAGVITDTELMTGYRQFGSRLQGHPTPVLPWSTSPAARWARASAMGSASRSPESSLSTRRFTCGCCAVTVKPPKDQYGRRSTKPATTR